MARIRTVKPSFFRHEALQDLEAANPGKYPMLVFAGIWGHCDKAGRFEWKPRSLKLDILPFLQFDMAETLAILDRAGLIQHYSVDGKEYGFVPTFEEHQRISGKEAQAGEQFPAPSGSNGDLFVEHRGSTGEAPGSAGREGNGVQEGKGYVGAHPDVAQLPKQKTAELRKAAAVVIEFLNAKAGRNFDINGANADHVVARLKDGETVEDCRAVIALKCREWKGDTKMAKYLRPETLFNRTKFATYKGELSVV